MGNLTTLTINNDTLNNLLDDPEGVVREIHNAACGSKTQTIHPSGVQIKVQKTRDADDHTLYIHMGNSLFEMNASSNETAALMKKNPTNFKEMLEYIAGQVEELQGKFEDYQSKDDPQD